MHSKAFVQNALSYFKHKLCDITFLIHLFNFPTSIGLSNFNQNFPTSIVFSSLVTVTPLLRKKREKLVTLAPKILKTCDKLVTWLSAHLWPHVQINTQVSARLEPESHEFLFVRKIIVSLLCYVILFNLIDPLLANHGKLIQKFFWNFHFPGRHTGRFTGKLIHSNFLTETIYDMKHLVWMSFPVKRPVWRPRILPLTIGWVFH